MIHLHLHSHYSLLDGLGKVDMIVQKAKEIGAPAVAVTDHASITAMPELFEECQKAGIKPIIGCEFYLTDTIEPNKDEKRYHLTAWAKSWAGVESLMERLSLANTQFYRRPRLQWHQALEFKDCVVATACSFGLLCRPNYEIMIQKFKEAYGEDFYLEIMPHAVDLEHEGEDMQKVVNLRAVDLRDKYGIKLVATNDAHYVNEEDAYTHKVLMSIQYAKRFDEWESWPGVFYMRTTKEMVTAFFHYCPYLKTEYIAEALKATAEIADKCDVKLPAFEVHLPSIHEDDEAVFKEMLMAGWAVKLSGRGGKAYQERLIYEISVIKKLGFIRYFLIVKDIIDWSRARGIMVGPARGSSAGSLCCYLLDITQVDPLEHGLFFERFLNPMRIDLPDIDTDFQDDRRGEVFDYIRRKYGDDKTANISTVTEMTLVTAFRDTARTFGVNALQVNLLSKQIQDDDAFESVPDLMKFKAASPQNALVVEQAKKLVGTIRQAGVHACGYIVSSRPLADVSVLERRRQTQVVNWDMRLCEKFGLLKMDVLGLTTLTILNRAAKMIRDRHGIEIDFTKLPLDDPKSMDEFRQGNCMGVFQFENEGMRELLRNLQASDFETLTATTALYRPGSLDSGETERFVKVAKGWEAEYYPCEQLRSILSPTKGVMVYQEQIMRIFVDLGGFNWAEADKMRKIIGKKLGADEFNKHKAHFMEGCAANGIESAIAEEIFDKMAEFAKYSFNKSHAVAYTIISVWCMYLKVHFPLEFFAATLTSSRDDRVALLIRDAQRFGINVMKPDINMSRHEYIIGTEPQTIIAPLGLIKGVGDKAVEAILAARDAAIVRSPSDLQERVYRRACTSRVMDALQRAGAFESLGVMEPDRSKREKDYAELLPMFGMLPTLYRKNDPYSKEALKIVMDDVADCCAARECGKVIYPVSGAKPAIMVINNPVKGETAHFQFKGSKSFLGIIKEYGITPANIYYTAPLKCTKVPESKEAQKECIGRCNEFLRNEIKVIGPKLIICFATNVIGMFTTDKRPTMAKLAGEVKYCAEFDCYVLFSYSPQYAFFNDDKVGDKFQKAMGLLGELFPAE